MQVRFQSGRGHWLGLLGVLLVALAWVAFIFPNTVHQPNTVFFSNSGDGIKNYFAALYYVRYDSTHQFTGMNYPFGEHLNYPDLQPLVSGVLSFLQRHGVPVAFQVVGVINGLLLLSLVFTPVIMYAILRRTRLPVVPAAVAALLIGFMAPQLARMDGHMALGYTCFIPILWYLCIRMQTQPRRWGWYVLYAVASVLMGLISAYYLAAAAFFLLAHALVLAWQERPRRPWRLIIGLIITALVPLLGFRGWLALTDLVTDRPENPYGLLVYVASFSSIFISSFEPVRGWWYSVLDWSEPAFEGKAYVGLVPVLVLMASLVLVVRYLGRRRWRRVLRPVLPPHLRVGLWASLLLLLLAMAVPVRYGNLADYAGPLKQFRSLGRFAWPFYYVFTTYAAYYVYRLSRLLRRRRKPGLALAVLVAPALIWALEAGQYSRTLAGAMDVRLVANDFVQQANNYQDMLSWANKSPADYQAILPLPYFSVGTDKLAIDPVGNIALESFKAALNLGLPLLTGQMARSSISQALAQAQLLSSPLVVKPIITKFPSTKPILLLVKPDVLTPAEQRILALAHRVAGNEVATLYELPLAALAATDLAAERAKAAQLLPTLPVRPDGLRVTTASGVMYNSFDKSPDRRGRLAPGAFAEPAQTFSLLYDGPLPAPADTGQYEAAAWVSTQAHYGLGNMQVKLFDAKNQQIDHQVGVAVTSTEIDGSWVRATVLFRVRPGTARMEILYDNRGLLLDDLLVRPLHTDVYHYVGQGAAQRLIKNGYVLNP